jgi:pyruvate,water dikinase
MVSGAVDPDRWTLERSSGKVLHWSPGQRGESDPEPLLVPEDVASLHETVLGVETLLGYPPDMEWTGRGTELTLLQARPVTSPATGDDERRWYLSLRPGSGRLADLCERVAYELIPALEAEGKGFVADELRAMDDPELAEAILGRHEAHERWKRIYREEFIPFAHGVRRFGQYYNDAVRPTDPYEFVGLLENQPMIASLRNDALAHLAEHVRREPALAGWLERPEVVEGISRRDSWKRVAAELPGIPGGEAFRRAFEEFLDEHMNLTYQDEPLDDRPDLILNIVRQLVTDGGEGLPPTRGGYAKASGDDVQSREERFLTAVGPERREEALEALRIGRLSWRLRDDDNILMGRLRNQLQHAVVLAAQRLKGAGRLPSGGRVKSPAAETLAEALRNPDGGPVRLEEPGKRAAPGKSRGSAEMSEHREDPGSRPRQLVGQPAARGLVTGAVRVIRSTEDFQAFRKDEILVCDAIQPTMTHLVPLASAIVERRGGMLIHGAIIARELGVPCVNGVPYVTDLLHDGELVTVDGHLGVVTVGPPEFDLEGKREG